MTCASDLLDSEDKYRIMMYNSSETFDPNAANSGYLPPAMGAANNLPNYAGAGTEYYMTGFPSNFAGMMGENAFNNQGTFAGSSFLMGEGSDSALNLSS